MREKDIVYEEGAYFAIQTKNGFEVYKAGITHSTRVAQIGYGLGIERVKSEIARRLGK
jgi:hypothetical protein